MYQPQGTTLLPVLSKQSQDSDIERMIKGIFRKLGGRGKAALHEYLSKSWLPANSQALALLDRVFKAEVVAGGGRGRGGAKGTGEAKTKRRQTTDAA